MLYEKTNKEKELQKNIARAQNILLLFLCILEISVVY